jgi:hypothetical protein
MSFSLIDSVDGAVVNGYVDGLDNEFENEDFNPPAEVEGRCQRNRVGVTRNGWDLFPGRAQRRVE